VGYGTQKIFGGITGFQEVITAGSDLKRKHSTLYGG